MIAQIKKELDSGAAPEVVARRLDIPVHWVLEVLEMNQHSEPQSAGSVVGWPFKKDFNYD